MAKRTLQIIITVEYETNGVLDSELFRMLNQIPQRAAEEGLFTGETAAEVITWEAKVEEVLY